MKPMTSEEVERVVTQAHADVLACMCTDSGAAFDRGVTKTMRAVFTAGQDNGQAIILERADEIMTPKVSDASVVQLGKSMTTVLAWVQALDGRVFTGLTSMRDRWAASVMVAESEKRGGTWSRHSYGSTPAEALSVLATWCAEHEAKAEAVAS